MFYLFIHLFISSASCFFIKIETEGDEDVNSDDSDSESNHVNDLSNIREMRLIPSDPTQCMLSSFSFINGWFPLWILVACDSHFVFVVLQWILCFKFSVNVRSLIQIQMMVSIVMNIGCVFLFMFLTCLAWFWYCRGRRRRRA